MISKNNSVVLQILCGSNQIHSYTDFLENRQQQQSQAEPAQFQFTVNHQYNPRAKKKML